jgi:hypothetical protein
MKLKFRFIGSVIVLFALAMNSENRDIPIHLVSPIAWTADLPDKLVPR